MDTQLFLKINALAKRTSWAHGFMREYALYVGLALLAATVLVALFRSVLMGQGDDLDRRSATVIWTGVAALVAFAINQPLSHLIGSDRPYLVLHGVEVLIPRANDPGLPSDHATIAGAVIVGLWLSRDRLMASAATIFGLFLAFARVYVGAHYPSDVIAGLAFGAIVSTAGYFVVVTPLANLIGRLRSDGPDATHHATTVLHRPPEPGPASDPVRLEATGAVRLLSERPITPAGVPKTPDPKEESTSPSKL